MKKSKISRLSSHFRYLQELALNCWKFWKFCFNLNRTRLHNTRRPRAEQPQKRFCNKNLSFISPRRTRNSQFIEKYDSFSHICFQCKFMLKTQQKVDIKLSKIRQNHQKLSEWQKFAPRFTEIVHKSSSSEDSSKCRRRFKLFVDLLDSLEQGRTSNWILMTPILAPANSVWSECWLCWLCCIVEIIL